MNDVCRIKLKLVRSNVYNYDSIEVIEFTMHSVLMHSVNYEVDKKVVQNFFSLYPNAIEVVMKNDEILSKSYELSGYVKRSELNIFLKSNELEKLDVYKSIEMLDSQEEKQNLDNLLPASEKVGVKPNKIKNI